ncbi:MAG TPA: hypothetical protein VET23_10700, partial [Chitinophagaceae bacterium]|nr:hypothetical protein [Chitinophagaceae bacterium]
ESQIQLALERVRARTMAMQRSEELSETAAVLFEQLKHVGEKPERAFIGVVNEEEHVIEVWATHHGGTQLNMTVKASIDEPMVMNRMYVGWKAGKKSLVIDLKGDELESYFQYLKGIGAPVSREIFGERRFENIAFFSKGMLGVITPDPQTTESILLYERFAGVFDLTYTRFLDLKKAEAQVREAQVEASLERVRAKTMAMHSSDDVTSATATMFTELEKLGIENMRCGIAHYLEGHQMEVWSVSNLADGKVVRGAGLLDTNSIPFWKIFYSTWQKKEDFLYYYMAGEEKEDYFKKISTVQNYLSQSIENVPDLSIQAYYFPEGSVWAFSLKPHSETDKQVMKRFASGFSLTFRRYQDLKKAEAQAREATIEASLERVRSKTMAMHNSQDVGDTVATMFDELVRLGVETVRCGIGIMDEPNQMEVWTAKKNENEKVELIIGRLDMATHPLLQGMYNGWKNKDITFSYELAGDDLINYFTNLINSPGYHIKYDIASLPKRQFHNDFYFPEGALFAFSAVQLSAEASQIFKRFAGVFGQTYRRYQDLKKAEAQAREATIEAALEKVRGKAMGMHNSNDLSATASMVFTELRKLGINPMRCGVSVHNKENRKNLLYSSTTSEQGDNLSLIGWAVLDDHPVLKEIYDSWLRREDYFPVLKGELLKSYYEKIKSSFVVPEQQSNYEQYGYFLAFSEGMFYGWGERPFTGEEIKILKRFATVIDL